MPETAQTNFDFSAYRKPELAERIGAVVGLPRSVLTIAKWGFLCVVAVWVALPLVYGGRVHWGWLLGCYLYGSVAAMGIGVLLGCVVALNKVLDNLVSVLDISLEISEQVSRDSRGVLNGSVRVPTARETVVGVYDGVVLPTLEGVLCSQSRLAGRAAFAVYHWSLGRLMKRVLAIIPEEKRDDEKKEEAEEATTDSSVISKAAAGADSVAAGAAAGLAKAREYVARIGHGSRRIVLAPLVGLLACSMLVALVPLVILWFLAG